MKDKAITSLSELNIRHRRDISDFESNLNGFMKIFQSPGCSVRQVISGLGTFGINNAALFMYDEPVKFEYGKYDMFPDRITLVSTIKNGETYMTPAERGVCGIDEIFTHRSLPVGCRAFAAFPVFFRANIYGFILIEADNTIYTRGEFIASLLGRTIFLNSV